MALKTFINGQAKTLSARTKTPVTFNNGSKVVLTKGMTFQNGLPVHLWGFESTIEFFSFTDTQSNGKDAIIYIGTDKLLTTTKDTYNANTAGTRLFNISNLSNISLISGTSWGGGVLYDPVASDATYTVFHLGDNNTKTRNTIKYANGASSIAVDSTFTGTVASTMRWAAKLANSTLWGSFSGGGRVDWTYYIVNNNTVVQQETTANYNPIYYPLAFNGSDTVITQGLRGTGLYKVVASGGSNFGSNVWLDNNLINCMFDGNNIISCGIGSASNHDIVKIDGSGNTIWYADLPGQNLSTNARIAILVGKSPSDNTYYIIDEPRTTINSDNNVYLRKYNASDGTLEDTFLLDYEDENKNPIKNWTTIPTIAHNGYLGAMYRDSNKVYVLRIYVG